MSHTAFPNSSGDYDVGVFRWEVLLALHHHEREWDGLITTDDGMLALPRELAVLMQTQLTLVVAHAAGHDPLKATGGSSDDGLANLALQWMLKEAEAKGLAVDPDYLRNYRGYAQDRLYRSESLFYRCFDAVRWRAGRGRRSLVGWPQSTRLTLDVSVIWRIQTDPKEERKGHPDQPRHPALRKPYRPDNVLRFLANQADLVALLKSIGIEPPALPPDVTRRFEELHSSK